MSFYGGSYFGGLGLGLGEETPEENAVYFEGDWNGDGFFSTEEDMMSILRRLQCKRGEDNASMLVGASTAGRLSVLLNNLEGDFSSFNTSSPLYGNILPGRKMRLRVTTPVNKVLWTGEVDKVRPTVQAGKPPMVQIEALGAMASLSRYSNVISSPTLSNIQTGDAVDALLDAAGFPSDRRQIDVGSLFINHLFFEGTSALEAVRQVAEDTELGSLTEGLDWDLRFEGRYYRDLHKLVSQATFSDAPAAALKYRIIDQQDPLKELFNEINGMVERYNLGQEETIWQLAEATAIESGASHVFVAGPDAGVDGVLDGGVAAVASWTQVNLVINGIAYGFIVDPEGSEEDFGPFVARATPKSMKMFIEIEAATDLVVTLLAASGQQLFRLRQPHQILIEDVASKTLYGRRTYPLPGRWYSSPTYAANAAALLLSKVKDPQPLLTIGLTGNDPARLTQMWSRDLGDRITLVANNETKLGINTDFYIEAITHTLEAGKPPTTTWELSQAPPDPGWLILDESLLDGDDVLAY